MGKVFVVVISMLLLAALTACSGRQGAVWADGGHVGIPPNMPVFGESDPETWNDNSSQDNSYDDYTDEGNLGEYSNSSSDDNPYDEIYPEPEPECCPYYGCPEHPYGCPEPERRPIVALTFDDGPSRYTGYLLDILEEHGVRATFCVLGYRVEEWSDTILRMVDSGNEVIGHSWNHRNFAHLNEDAIYWQITETTAALETVMGFAPPPLFRAPYGIINARVRDVARDLGYSMLNWTVDPKDWYRNSDANIIHEHIMDRVVDGAIILLHDVRLHTIEAMALTVPALIEMGFDIVPASEVLEFVYGELTPGWEFFGERRRN